MPEDILKQTAPKKMEPTKKKTKIAALGVILAIILAIVLILLGERIIFDLNRVANPVIEKTQVSTSRVYPRASGFTYERSALSKTQIAYPAVKREQYVIYKIIIHATFIIPIFLLTFLLYYHFNIKRKDSHWRVVMWAYVFFAIWMILHLLGETAQFVIEKYENAAIYIILGVFAIVFTLLAVFIQKKVAEKHEQV